MLDLPQEVEQLLGAAHGKGGNDDVAAPGKGVVDELGQGLHIALRDFMVPVAVGGLHDHIVGLVQKLRIADDGLVDIAQVAGKDQLFSDATLCGPDLHHGGAQKVPRVPEADAHTVAQVQDLAVLCGEELLKGGLGVGHSVQGLHRRPAGALALLVLPLRVALLDEGGVPQHDRHQLTGQTGGEDLALKALFHQQGDPAGVVDMGVGHDDVVDVAGGEIQRVFVVLVPALLKTAVDEDLFAVDLQAVAAAGDRVGRAEKCELHTRCLLIKQLDCDTAYLSILYIECWDNSSNNL